MSATKVNINEIPKDILGDIQALVQSSKKEYIAIGASIYQIEPAPATTLMEAMGEFAELLERLRKKKIEAIKEEIPDADTTGVGLFVRDIIYNSASGVSLSGILSKLLQGVDKADIDSMNVGQMLNAIDKAIKINIDTLPGSFKETFAAPSVDQEPSETQEGTTDSEIKNP